MKFSCTQENLQNGLSLVSNIAGKNSTLPILNNVLFKVSDGRIDLSVTNLEVGVNYSIRGKVEQEGSFTLPAKILTDYVSLLPKEKIDLELKESEIFVQSSTSKTKIKGMDASEFPLIPQIQKKSPIWCDLHLFISALEQVLFAVSTNDARPEISGIYFHKNAGESTAILAATDSYRLAEKKIPLKFGDGVNQEQELALIIPARTSNELLRILTNFSRSSHLTDDSVDNKISLYLSENQIMFNFENLDLVSRLIEGSFPDYQQIIPSSFKTQAVIPVSELINAVKTSSLFARAGIFDIVLELTHDGAKVSSVNSQIGENTSLLPCVVTGPENKVILNYRYLLDGLLNLQADEVIMELSDANVPCVLRPSLKQAEQVRDYFYLIMPIRQ